jgi:hypothetical protein
VPSANRSQYWFPAKRYGWGWGFLCAWQGWLVFAAFLALIIAGIFLFPPAKILESIRHLYNYITLISMMARNESSVGETP